MNFRNRQLMGWKREVEELSTIFRRHWSNNVLLSSILCKICNVPHYEFLDVFFSVQSIWIWGRLQVEFTSGTINSPRNCNNFCWNHVLGNWVLEFLSSWEMKTWKQQKSFLQKHKDLKNKTIFFIFRSVGDFFVERMHFQQKFPIYFL